MSANKPTSGWETVEHAFAYLARADNLPHRTEGEKVLLDQIQPHDKARFQRSSALC
jgi:hypothetical protein